MACGAPESLPGFSALTFLEISQQNGSGAMVGCVKYVNKRELNTM
jgi:hypothetical protein